MQRSTEGAIELPPSGTTRWVASRKAAVARAVDAGEITAAWAIEAYGLTIEELNAWRSAHAQHGKDGLRATRPRECRAAKPMRYAEYRLPKQP